MNTFVDSVNAELRRRHQGLHVAVGWKERSQHTRAPAVLWVADTATFGAPVPREQADSITQSFVGRVLRFKVEVWGETPADTNRLVKSVLRVMHRLGTVGAYEVEGEEWTGLEGSGGAILGELATLTVGVRDDINDDDDTTADPPFTQGPPDGGPTE